MAEQGGGPIRGLTIKSGMAKNKVLAAYGIMALGLFTGIFWIVGVILVWSKKNEIKGTEYESHYQNIIRLFWWGLGLIIVGVSLGNVAGTFIALAVWVWAFFKISVGLYKVVSNKTVDVKGKEAPSIFGKVASRDFKEQFEKLWKKSSIAGQGLYLVSNFELDKSLNGDSWAYMRQYVPSNNMVNDITFGQISGGAIGAAQNIQSYLGGIKHAQQSGAMFGCISGFGYGFTREQFASLEPELKYPILGICALYCHNLIDIKIYSKSLATLFRSYASPNIKKDALGEPDFPDELSRAGAAVGYQYYMERVSEEEKVLGLFDGLVNQLPKEAIEKVKDCARAA